MQKSAIEILELFGLCLVDTLVLLGNVLVILAFILGSRSIRTYTNYFVVNLAVSDLCVGFISLPFWIVNRVGEFDLEKSIVYTFYYSAQLFLYLT